MVMGFVGGIGSIGAVLRKLLMLSRPRKASHAFCVIPGKPLYVPSSFRVSQKFGGQTLHARLIAKTNIPLDPKPYAYTPEPTKRRKPLSPYILESLSTKLTNPLLMKFAPVMEWYCIGI